MVETLTSQTAKISASSNSTAGITATQLSELNSALTDISLKNNAIRDKQVRQIEQLKEILSIQPIKMNFPIEIESTDKNLIYPFNWVNL